MRAVRYADCRYKGEQQWDPPWNESYEPQLINLQINWVPSAFSQSQGQSWGKLSAYNIFKWTQLGQIVHLWSLACVECWVSCNIVGIASCFSGWNLVLYLAVEHLTWIENWRGRLIMLVWSRFKDTDLSRFAGTGGTGACTNSCRLMRALSGLRRSSPRQCPDNHCWSHSLWYEMVTNNKHLFYAGKLGEDETQSRASQTRLWAAADRNRSFKPNNLEQVDQPTGESPCIRGDPSAVLTCPWRLNTVQKDKILLEGKIDLRMIL